MYETGASGNHKQAAQKSDFREKENKEAKPCDVPAHLPGSWSFRMARMYAESGSLCGKRGPRSQFMEIKVLNSWDRVTGKGNFQKALRTLQGFSLSLSRAVVSACAEETSRQGQNCQEGAGGMIPGNHTDLERLYLPRSYSGKIFPLLFFFFLIGGWLVYKVVLVNISLYS